METSHASSSLSVKERPPLRVAIVTTGMDEEIQLRWKSFSDQPIQIDSLTEEQACDEADNRHDVWIYPGNLMGSLIAAGKIAPLPPSGFGKPPAGDSVLDSSTSAIPAGQSKDQRNDFAGASSSSTAGSSASELWPARWKNASRFGGMIYAMPFGSPQMAVLSKNVLLAPLQKIDEANSATDDRSALAAEAWSEILATVPSTKGSIKTDLAALTPEQRSALVDRFLFIASTTNAKRRGFFDITRMNPRLATPDFVLAADILTRLNDAFPNMVTSSLSQSWSECVTTKEAQCLSIGWPSPSADDEVTSDEGLEVGKVTWNPNRGLMVSLSAKTRQTSVSIQFIAWLADAEQRNSIASASELVERWPAGPNPNLVRPDYRMYQNVNNRDVRPEPMNLSLRFANCRDYREALADCLVEILNNPEKSRELLAKCNTEWNKITDKYSLATQRVSLEQSLGFGQ